MNYRKTQHAKDISRDSKLKTKFGINLPTYEKILKEQNGVCYICGQEDSFRGLAVDHDHNTGRVRGLLCGNCNRGIGLLMDSPDLLRKALKYLERDYIIQSEKDIERIDQANQARWRNLVTTPRGKFTSFVEAGEYYGVHETTIGGWCGNPAYLSNSAKDRSSEGFSYELKKISLKEAQKIIQNENNDK